MIRQLSGIVLILAAGSLADTTYAGTSSCSVRQDDWASRNLTKATSLTEIYAISNKVPGCLKGGGIAEEVSDDVALRLSHHWQDSLEELSGAKSDSGLVPFVLRHIDGTADSNDLQVILKNSKFACSPKSKTLCRRVEVAAQSALNGQ